jgi:hypothetical protein
MAETTDFSSNLCFLPRQNRGTFTQEGIGDSAPKSLARADDDGPLSIEQFHCTLLGY